MLPPTEAGIDVGDSPDGSELVVKWPVVMGAGGYEVRQYDVTTAGSEVLVKTENVDGCTVNMPREEDTKYRFEIRSLGNSALNNTSSTTSSKKEHSTIIDATDYIAPGDLAAYFTPGKLSSEVGDTLCYDLEPGGIYTMSANIDLGGHWVTFRSKDKEVGKEYLKFFIVSLIGLGISTLTIYLLELALPGASLLNIQYDEKNNRICTIPFGRRFALCPETASRCIPASTRHPCPQSAYDGHHPRRDVPVEPVSHIQCLR